MKKILNKVTFTNFVKYGLLQWAFLHCFYSIVFEGILTYLGEWYPIWRIRENYIVASDLHRNCIWCWVPGITYFVICGICIWNEKRILKQGESSPRKS